MNIFDQFDSTGIEQKSGNVFDKFDIAESTTPVPVPESTDIGMEMASKVLDVAKGEVGGFATPETPEPSVMDVLKGIPQGLAAVGTGIGSFVGSLPVTAPIVMEGLMAGEPIEGLKAAGEEAEKIREAFSYQPTTRTGQIIAYDAAYPFAKFYQGLEAGVKALGGDEETVKVANYIADWVIVGAPKVFGKVKKKGAKPPPVPEELLREEIKSTKVDLAPDMVDIVVEAVRKKEKEIGERVAKGEVEGPKVEGAAKIESNQPFVDRLKLESEGREGYSKNALKKASKIVEGLDRDVREVNFKDVKGIGPKTEAIIQEMALEIEVPRPKVSGEVLGEVPMFEGPKVEPKIEPTVVEVPKEPIKPPKIEPPKIPEFETLEGLKLEVDLGSEISRKQAKMELATPEGVEFGVAKVGEKYYRTTAKDLGEPVLREPTSKELREAELEGYPRTSLEEGVPEGMVRVDGKTVPVGEAAKAFGVWRDSLVRDIVKDKETLPLIDKGFRTFKSKEEVVKYQEERGVVGEPIQDPMSKEWFVEPEFKNLEDHSWNNTELKEPVLYEEGKFAGDVGYGEPSKGLVRDLVDMFNNERGAVDVTPLRIFADKVEGVLAKAKKEGKDLEGYLKGLGLSAEIRGKFIQAARGVERTKEKLRGLEPETEKILRPEPESVVHQRVIKNKKGEVIGTSIPVTRGQVRKLFTAPKREWGPGKIGRFMKATEIRLNALEYRYGKEVKEMFWDPWTKLATAAKRERGEVVREMSKKKEGFSSKELEEVYIKAYAEQKHGSAALKASGVTKIPELGPRQVALLDSFRDSYDRLFERINYIRSRVGLEPVPKIENYFPFIHAQNTLKAHGIVDSITTVPLRRLEGSMGRFKGSFFPFGKERKGSKLPLELDIFKAHETYMSYAMKEIHIAPLAALAKEVSIEGFRIEKGKPKVKLVDQNPGLAKILNDWADEILGIDPVQRMIRERQPALGAGLDSIQMNLVSSMLMLNASTVLKQPTAILGAWVRTSTLDTALGIARMMVEKPFKGKRTVAARKSNVIDIRQFDILISEFTEALQLGVLKGSKVAAQKLGSMLIGVTDSMTADASWYAGYRHARKTLKLRETAARQWADDLVVRTQGMGIKGAVSPIQAYGAYKWIMLLQTFAIADFNFLARDVVGIKNPSITKPKQVGRVLKYVIGAAIINAMFEGAGMDAPKPSPIEAYSESKEKGQTEAQALAMATLELAELVPILGNIKYASSFLGPVGEFASDVPEGILTTVEMLDWENMSKKQRLHSGLFVGQLFGAYHGIPGTNQLVKSIRTWARGGSTYETLLGIYVEDARKRGGKDKSGPTKAPAIRTQSKPERVSAMESTTKVAQNFSRDVEEHIITRLKVEAPKAKENLDTFVEFVAQLESSGGKFTKSGQSTAKGNFQIVESNITPTANRLERIIGKHGWLEDVKETKDPRTLSDDQQRALFLADISERRLAGTWRGKGDELLKRILTSGDKDAMIELYVRAHLGKNGIKSVSKDERRNIQSKLKALG